MWSTHQIVTTPPPDLQCDMLARELVETESELKAARCVLLFRLFCLPFAWVDRDERQDAACRRLPVFARTALLRKCG